MLARGLAAFGHEVVVIETNPPEYIRLLLIRGPETIISWLSLYGSRRYRSWVEELYYLFQVYRITGGSFDILNLQNIRYAGIGKWLQRWCHCAVVATVHGYLTYEAESDKWCSVGDKAHRWLWRTETKGYGKMDAIICVAEKTKKYVSQFTAKPIVVIPNGLDTELYSPRQTLQDQGRVTILFSGAIQKAKGIFVALEAVALLVKQGKAIRLRIAGNGDQLAEVKKFIQERNLLEHVELLGFVDKQDMPDFYRSGEILLFPSQSSGVSGVSEESFPYAVLEAMACGVAVVAFETGGLREQVRDGIDGYLIQPGDMEELTRSLSQLIDDPVLRKKMGENARTQCVGLFSHIQMARQFLRIFAQVHSPAKLE
jgi:glycosyltransferase involved in cell wall biosynthesis